MTPAAWGALGIAVFGAISYAAGSILQAVGARRSTGTVRTLGHPLYLLGVGCDILSWAGSMVALRELAVYQVQSVLAGSLAITVIMARIFLGSRVRRRDAFAVVITVGALAVLAMSAGPQEQVAASTQLRIGFCAAAGLTVILGWLAAKFTTPGVVAGLSGLAFGGAALAGRALQLPEHPTSHVSATLVAIFTEPLTAALVVFAAAGMLMYTHALQHGQVGPVTAVLWIGEVVAPSAVGLLLLGDTVLPGWELRAAVAGFIVVASAVVLATAPATSDTAQPAPAGSPAPALPVYARASDTGQLAIPAAAVYARAATTGYGRPAILAATVYGQPAGAGAAATSYAQPAVAGMATGYGQAVGAGFPRAAAADYTQHAGVGSPATVYRQPAGAGFPRSAATDYEPPAGAGLPRAAAAGAGFAPSADAGFPRAADADHVRWDAEASGQSTTGARPAVGANPGQAGYPVWPPPTWHEPTPAPGRLSSGMTVWWGPPNDRRPIFIPPDRPRTAWAPAAPPTAPRRAPRWAQQNTGHTGSQPTSGVPVSGWPHPTSGIPTSPPPLHPASPAPAWAHQSGGMPMVPQPRSAHQPSAAPISPQPNWAYQAGHPSSGVPHRTYETHQPAYDPTPTWAPQPSPEPAPAWINHGGVPTLAHPPAPTVHYAEPAHAPRETVSAESRQVVYYAEPAHTPREQAGWA